MTPPTLDEVEVTTDLASATYGVRVSFAANAWLAPSAEVNYVKLDMLSDGGISCLCLIGNKKDAAAHLLKMVKLFDTRLVRFVRAWVL
ncbi:unnamed protein product [Peronospora destructor]|uniref:Uncharacterized protein n=1 Tax=Peronospora destructor TaxID=86335 RepID=A0AAV0UHC7_9STRA|nr:unnamed protein product [Peronospora destructor]